MTTRALLFAFAVAACACPLQAGDAAAAAAGPAAEGAHQDDAQILAAARAADAVYQQKFYFLVDRLRSPDESERVLALSELGHLMDPMAVPVLLPYLQASNRSSAEIIAAASALSSVGAASSVPVLHNLLKHPDPAVRVTAMNVLTSIQQIQPNDYKARADDREDTIRGSSLTELGTLVQTDSAAVLAKGLASDTRPHIRRMCAIGLGNLGDRAQGPNLADALCDADPGVRRYAAEALVRINYTPAIPALLMALESNVAGEHINRCLKLMTKQDFGFDPRGDTLGRAAAIEKGFQWWTANAKDLNTK
jgi:HEAT repeat protein